MKPSHWRGLAKYPLAYIPVERFPGSDVNLYSEELLQVSHEPGVVEQATSWFPVHPQVEAARGGRFFALFAAQIPPASR